MNSSFSEGLLEFLFYYSGGARCRYTDIKRLSYEELNKKIKEDTLRKTLTRLKKRGFVKNESGFWGITKRGRQYIKIKLADPFRSRGPYEIAQKKERNMIVAFDVPEYKRKTRDWLRNELRLLGFEPLQKSVWFGTAPLPEKFIAALNELNLIPCMKFFDASEANVV